MPTMKQLEKEEARLKAELSLVKEAINNKLRETKVTCEKCFYGDGCGKQTRIVDLTYIQTMWYETPYSCTGGDRWHEGEGQFICPGCGKRNRLYNHPEIEKLKWLFASIEQEFPKRQGYRG